jgi:hypothetical protein
VRRSAEIGVRKFDRVTLQRPGFILFEPNGPWIECLIVDVSNGGVCLNVGILEVPKMFGLLMTSDGRVSRVCLTAWRTGELLGARFLTVKELRDGAAQNVPGPNLTGASF